MSSLPVPRAPASAFPRRPRRSASSTPSTGRTRTSSRRPGPATPPRGSSPKTRPPRRPDRRDAHREVDLRGRPPHDAPARPLPVLARERVAPVPLDVPARPPLLQLGAGLASATSRSSRGNYAVPAAGRRSSADIYEKAARAPAGGLRAADGAADAARGRALLRALSGPHARRRPDALCGLDQEDGAGDRALRAAGRDLLLPLPHGLRASRSSATGASASPWTRPPSSARSSGRWWRRCCAHDPLYASVLEDPIPLEETPEYAAFQALPRVRGRRRASSAASSTRELGGRVSQLVDWKANNEEILAAGRARGARRAARRALRRRRDPPGPRPGEEPLARRDADPDDARQAVARALPRRRTRSARSSRTRPTARTSATA